MRKLYALLAGLCLALCATIPTRAQQPANDIANFTFAIDASTNNVVFTNTSVLSDLPGLRRAYWTFGDGTRQWTGPLQNTEHRYAIAGTYNVCLRIYRFTPSSNDSILSAEICKTLTIEQVCRANFEYRDSIASTNPLRHIVRFWALPFHNANKRVTEICWNFGDGTDTCIQYNNTNPAPNNLSIVHHYTQQGPYNVCVRIKYEGGCVAEKCKPVIFQNPPPADSCTADFERINLTTTNDQLHATFKAIPWHNNGKRPARICWIFGDGRDTCIQYATTFTGPYTVNHTYNQPGQYEVCVKILYQGGCEARKCRPIQVGRPDSCRAEFERLPVASTNDPLSVSYKAFPYHNNNKKPKTICWKFGDGSDTCINYGADYNGSYVVNHRYNQPGQYEVCVKILYYGGCEARKCKLIVIPHDTCGVRIHEITPSATSLVRGLYAATTSLPPSRIERICWNFGDGTDTCINGSSANPPDVLIRHTYPAPGIYRACVRVFFANGCRAEDCEEVVIRSYNNICGGYMTDSLTAPRSFLFRGHSINNPNDQPVSFRWTFGDGSSAVGREVTHQYATAGEFEVCLYIKTALGCETRICKKVRVPGNNQPALVITPNPVHDVLHAFFFSTHTETVTIKLVNQNGVVIRTVTRNAVTGPNNWNFDAGNLAPGIYSMVVQSPNQQASVIFIKI